MDSTFAPPPLQYPFDFGADTYVILPCQSICLIHRFQCFSLWFAHFSFLQTPAEGGVGTKYFGGHSDLLCGVLVVKTLEEWNTVCLVFFTCLFILPKSLIHSYIVTEHT